MDRDVFSTFRAKTFLEHDFTFFDNDARGANIKQGRVSEESVFPGLSLLFELLPGDGTCLDVGANIGLHTAFFTRFFRRTFSFEPNPYVFDVLQENIRRNTLPAFPVKAGLSDEDAKLPFHIHKTNLGQSTFSNDIAVRSHFIPTEAQVVRGDAFLQAKGVTDVRYIKIDVEGFEARAIAGLGKTIGKNKPVISFEWNNDVTRRDFAEKNLFQALLSGYLPFGFDNGGWTEFVVGNRYELAVLLPRELVPAFREKIRTKT